MARSLAGFRTRTRQVEGESRARAVLGVAFIRPLRGMVRLGLGLTVLLRGWGAAAGAGAMCAVIGPRDPGRRLPLRDFPRCGEGEEGDLRGPRGRPYTYRLLLQNKTTLFLKNEA